MSPYKRTPNSSYTVERVLSGIGRVRLATGVKDKHLAQRYDDLLTDLHREGRGDYIRDLAAKKY